MDFPRVEIERKDVVDVETLLMPMRDLVSNGSFSEEKKSFDARYAQLISCTNDYFEYAVIPVQKRKILFGAYAPLHRHAMSMAYSVGLERVLPFGAVWSNFSRVYYFLELDKFRFDGADLLEEVAQILSRNSLGVEMAALESLRSCAHPSLLRSKRNRATCEEALQNFRKLVGMMSNADERRQVLERLSVFEVHLKSFSVQMQMRQYVKKINECVVREAIFYEKEPHDDIQAAMKQFFAFGSLFLRVMSGDSDDGDCKRRMRRMECASSLFGQGDMSSFDDFKEIVVPLAGHQKLEDTGPIKSELYAYFATLGVEHWDIREKYAKLMKMKHHVECNDIRPLFTLVAKYTEFLTENRLDDVYYNGLVMRLLLSYSAALVKVAVFEDCDAIQTHKTRMTPPKTEKNFLVDMESLLRDTRELLEANVTSEEATRFLNRFLTLMDIMGVLYRISGVNTRTELLNEILKFVPDLRLVIPNAYNFEDCQVPSTVSAVISDKVQSDGSFDWQAIISQAAAVYQGVLSDIDRHSLLSFLKRLQKVVNFEKSVVRFASNYLHEEPKALVRTDNEFASELHKLLGNMVPILRRGKNFPLTKACFDLSLCVVFDEFSHPEAVIKPWKQMLEGLTFPDFENHAWSSLRYAELLVMRRKQSETKDTIAETFLQKYSQFLLEATEANGLQFKDSLRQVLDLMPKAWRSQYEEIAVLFDQYCELGHQIESINRKFYLEDPITRTGTALNANLFRIVMIGNLAQSVAHVISFALSEDLVPESMRATSLHARETLRSWAKDYIGIYSMNANLSANFFVALDSLRHVSFEDVQKKLSVRCVVFSSLLVSFHTLDVRLHRIRDRFHEIESKVRALEMSSDFEQSLFELLTLVTELNATVKSLEQSFETEALSMTLDRFIYFIVDALCVVCFDSDLVLATNAVGLLRRQYHHVEFTPAKYVRKRKVIPRPEPPKPAPVANESEKNQVLGLMESIDAMLCEISSTEDPKIDKARQALDGIGVILAELPDRDITEVVAQGRAGLTEINNEIHGEIVKREEAIKCLQSSSVDLKTAPETEVFESLLEEQKSKKHSLDVEIERHKMHLEKATEKHEGLSRRLARLHAARDAPENPTVRSLKALSAQLRRRSEGKKMPLTEETFSSLDAITKIRKQNDHLVDQIRRARLCLQVKQATGECPIEPPEAPPSIQMPEITKETDPKVAELQTILADATLSAERTISEKPASIEPEVWAKETASLEISAYKLIEALKEEIAEVDALTKVRDSLKARLAEKNQRITALLSKL